MSTLKCDCSQLILWFLLYIWKYTERMRSWDNSGFFSTVYISWKVGFHVIPGCWWLCQGVLHEVVVGCLRPMFNFSATQIPTILLWFIYFECKQQLWFDLSPFKREVCRRDPSPREALLQSDAAVSAFSILPTEPGHFRTIKTIA